MLSLIVFVVISAALETQPWFVHGTETVRLAVLVAGAFVVFALPAIASGSGKDK